MELMDHRTMLARLRENHSEINVALFDGDTMHNVVITDLVFDVGDYQYDGIEVTRFCGETPISSRHLHWHDVLSISQVLWNKRNQKINIPKLTAERIERLMALGLGNHEDV